ncbi:hypothetical protein [Burkholderia ubonensis]|uniref:hypothetical protein n=1 Tax=Burkholderia ubonensis TaxID=101571 RepID=UPI000759B05D|nr:hypothetical protein [Burkholderia ubonensis]KVL67344.1 hypothetical protein WJ48_13915 [Burkholderia ubonensis]KVL71397.1 hypothetical protein WJ49_20240 [Burkholderia ubonensis]KWK75605.1 hypothetical protein WM15_30635 [Burkholderia ubonensis]
MRWTPREKMPKVPKDPYRWHDAFLWFPDKIDGTWVWLETVTRRRVDVEPFFHGDLLIDWVWEYASLS